MVSETQANSANGNRWIGKQSSLRRSYGGVVCVGLPASADQFQVHRHSNRHKQSQRSREERSPSSRWRSSGDGARTCAPRAITGNNRDATDLSDAQSHLVRLRSPLLLLCRLFLLLLLSLSTREAQQVAGRSRSLRQANLHPQTVPYKTFYVTRACEWKSNLFVPKSNDIHFAQSAANEQVSGESAVAYETLASQQQQQQQQQLEGRTLLSIDSKALILALPIVMSQSFSGYESACSIRLIVPRNMRILAKLTSRRLTFAQQTLSDANLADPAANQQRANSLWLNVSQDLFAESEQRTIETEGNVLAFRFLLERFANKQVPDTRFQVVLTAFQTLSDNSDLSGVPTANWSPPGSTSADQQFICDQQRLISADLACDGFKNCQDGHDEEPATCSAAQPPKSVVSQVDIQVPRNQLSGDQEQRPAPLLTRLWQLARDTNSLAGFLLGLLLVLALITCCACCAHLLYLLWRRRRQRQEDSNRRQQLAASSESSSLAPKSADLASPKRLSEAQSPQQIPPRLQSILKRPSTTPLLEPTRPAQPPPAVPARNRPRASPVGTRGALASSLNSSRQGRSSPTATDFRPTPARRLTRPTRPVPTPSSGGSTGTQRVSTYHYSFASTSLSNAYLDRLAAEQRERPAAPPRGPPTNQPERQDAVSPQSSLI